MSTESVALALTSNLSFRAVSRFRAQFSRDLQSSTANSTDPLTKIPDIIEGFGRSSILPRQTREHRLHLAETFSVEGKRNSWKFGGDVLLTWIYNFFPSLSGGEYIFDPIKVNPFTFEPQESGLELTPLRAYAHEVPHYYLQSFGPSATNPDTNEYSGFLQDTIRVSDHFALSLGARYDLQTFTTKGLQSNPLWPDAGRVPFNTGNVAPRVGLAYSIGKERPLVIRAGYGLFYTRIPQIYTSAIQNDNGLAGNFLFLNNNNFSDHQIFPQYPNPLVNCPVTATNCQLPPGMAQLEQADVSAFSHNFKTPRVQQASLNLEREVAHRTSVGVSYMYVHGVDLIRARDVNLPPPVNVSYPVYDASGTNFLGTYYNVDSFSTVAIDALADLPVPALHQSAGASHSAARIHQCFRERGFERLPRRHPLHSPAHDQRRLLHAVLHLRARDRRWTGRAGGGTTRHACRTRTHPMPKEVRASPISASASCSPASWRPSRFIATTSGWEYSSTTGRPPAWSPRQRKTGERAP